MIDIHYFASVRERLGVDSEQLNISAGTVKDLVEALVAAHGEGYRKVLQDARVLVAVNQEVKGMDAVVRDGDEIAFFPPVTGG